MDLAIKLWSKIDTRKQLILSLDDKYIDKEL
jgi:hypothetical protein